MKDTSALHTLDTVQFNNHTFNLPSPTPADCIIATTKYLKNNIDQATPLATDDELSTINHIQMLLLSPTVPNLTILTHIPINSMTTPDTSKNLTPIPLSHKKMTSP